MKRKIATYLATVAFVLVPILSASAARANDSIAHIAAGGLILSRTDKVELESEDLFISAKRITVDYVFRNLTSKPFETIVAFPMPDIRAPSDLDNFVIPFERAANFLGFETKVNGEPVEMRVERRVTALGIDRTGELSALGISLEPHFPSILSTLKALPDIVLQRLIRLGMLEIEEFTGSTGTTRTFRPLWTLKTTYYWSQVFPANQKLHISHSYTPSVGGAAQTMVGSEYGEPSMLADYRRRYCIDRKFEQAAKRAHNQGTRQQVLSEQNLEYVLKTGANWAGPIKRFRLVVDKGEPGNLVSFCMKGVRRISSTRLEAVQKDFWPQRDLEVLILKPYNLD